MSIKLGIQTANLTKFHLSSLIPEYSDSSSIEMKSLIWFCGNRISSTEPPGNSDFTAIISPISITLFLSRCFPSNPNLEIIGRKSADTRETLPIASSAMIKSHFSSQDFPSIRVFLVLSPISFDDKSSIFSCIL